MIIPPLATTIDRRLLLNYKVDPEVLRRYLPSDPSVRLRLIDGWAVAGICLIRLTNLRPALVHPRVGLRAENAAHRFGIIHTAANGAESTAVYIPERHTTSWLAKLAGGVVFPGKHHHARFDVLEGGGAYHVRMRAAQNAIEVRARKTDEWASDLFPEPEQASNFFKDSPVGYSPRPRGGQLDAVELITPIWQTTPLAVDEVHSTFYDDLPAGSVQFDDALLMEHIDSRWTKPKS